MPGQLLEFTAPLRCEGVMTRGFAREGVALGLTGRNPRVSGAQLSYVPLLG